MRLPELSEHAIARSIPGVCQVLPPLHGGQKLVFPCLVDGNWYALKVMLLDDERAPAPGGEETGAPMSAAEARARQEVGIMRRCQNPHLATPGTVDVTVADIEGQRVVYFTEEWVNGQDLRTMLRERGPLSFREVVRLGIDIAQAIDALWSEHIVHRDVKPGNIVRRSATGEFLLLDLGSALDLNAATTPARTGRMPGTRMYFSPERMTATRLQTLDHRSDLFSLGIVLYEAATGVHPFALAIADDIEILARIKHVNPLRPSSFRPHIPFCLSAVIMRLLAKAPSRRYDTCFELIKALEAC